MSVVCALRWSELSEVNSWKSVAVFDWLFRSPNWFTFCNLTDATIKGWNSLCNADLRYYCCQHRKASDKVTGQSWPHQWNSFRINRPTAVTVYTVQCCLPPSKDKNTAAHFFLVALFPSPFFGFPFPLSFLRRIISSLKSSCSSLRTKSKHFIKVFTH